MTNKLKKLSDLATEDGPIYNRFKLAIEEWLKAYNKRNEDGDINVIKFLKHFGEINENDRLQETRKKK